MRKGGPKTKEGKAKALANLVEHKHPNWLPGVSGNPAGRPNAGAAVAEWYNQMEGWSLERLKKVAADPKAPSSQVAAAQQWLQSRDGNGGSLDRICDRTDGRPAQSKTVTHQGPDGGPVEVNAHHNFDHDRFGDFFRRRPGIGRNGDRAANGNGHH